MKIKFRIIVLNSLKNVLMNQKLILLMLNNIMLKLKLQNSESHYSLYCNNIEQTNDILNEIDLFEKDI